MSHTSEIRHENQTYVIHHNGDFSGNATIDLGSLDLATMEASLARGEPAIEIPIEVLKELIGRHLQARAISHIEQMSGAAYLDSMAPEWQP